MKYISNSKVGWPECLIGQIDPKEHKPILSIQLCPSANHCNSMNYRLCGRITVIIEDNLGRNLAPMCNVIPRELEEN